VSALADLGIAAHKVTSKDVNTAVTASLFSRSRLEGSASSIRHLESVAAISFEEFLDVLGRCALLVGKRTAPEQPTSGKEVVLAGKYSTAAKQLWVAEATVRSCVASLSVCMY
jgi:hypothetical protein